MWRDPERPAEGSRELGRPGIELGRGGRHRDRFEAVRVEVVPQPAGEHPVRIRGLLRRTLAEARPDPLGDQTELGLGLERVIGAGEGVVERGHLSPERSIGDDRPVHGRTDEVLAKHGGLKVDDSLDASRQDAPGDGPARAVTRRSPDRSAGSPVVPAGGHHDEPWMLDPRSDRHTDEARRTRLGQRVIDEEERRRLDRGADLRQPLRAGGR